MLDVLAYGLCIIFAILCFQLHTWEINSSAKLSTKVQNLAGKLRGRKGWGEKVFFK